MTDLGLMRNITQPQLEDILDGQYQLAKSRNNKKWIQDARREAKAIQLMSDHWIDTVLPSTSREPVPKRRTKSSGAATSYDGSMCRNFRLDRDPSIEVYRSNAAESTSDVPSVSVNIAETAEPLDLTNKEPRTFSYSLRIHQFISTKYHLLLMYLINLRMSNPRTPQLCRICR